ncbi:MAG: hypothetical protein WCO11_08575 [Sphingomonadales bacterium]|jgi:hypothetical protein
MRQYLSSLLWIAATTTVVAAAQVITTRAAAERRAVTRLNIELVENTVRVRELEAELRTRAGLPELQRWNDAVFQMAAPQGGQILRSPVQLAAYAAQPERPPAVQYAVAETGLPPVAAAPAQPAAPAPVAGARLVRTSYGDAAAPVVTDEDGADPTEPQGGED